MYSWKRALYRWLDWRVFFNEYLGVACRLFVLKAHFAFAINYQFITGSQI